MLLERASKREAQALVPSTGQVRSVDLSPCPTNSQGQRGLKNHPSVDSPPQLFPNFGYQQSDCT